jgi:hypothetical protein
MSKLPIPVQAHAAADTASKAGEVTVPVPEAEHSAPPGPFPLFSFTCSFREITFVDGQTRVRSHQAQLVNGKLQTEDFDATLGGAEYAEAIAETQRLAAEQMTFLLRQFSHFLPFWRR